MTTATMHADLAPRDPTADLLLAATRRFCESEHPSREDHDLYREAFYSAIHRLDTATRQAVATLLSHTPFCPRPIALFLAMDVPAVAHSMIKHSAVLGERDLLQLLDKTTPIHARLLAARPHISEAVVARIADCDDADIHRALADNATLVLEPAMADRLCPAERGPLRRTVQASAPAERAKSDAVQTTLAEALARTRPGHANRKRSVDPAEFRRTFEAAAMRRDRKAMVEAMRDRFGLAHRTALQALDDRTGDALQVMMKAEGFDAAQAHRIVMLAIPAVGLSPAASERSREIWERLKVDTCRAALAQWPRDEGRLAHAATVSEAEGVRREDGRRADPRVTITRHRLTG